MATTNQFIDPIIDPKRLDQWRETLEKISSILCQSSVSLW